MVAPTLSPMLSGRPLSGANGAAEFASSAIAFRVTDFSQSEPSLLASAPSRLICVRPAPISITRGSVSPPHRARSAAQEACKSLRLLPLALLLGTSSALAFDTSKLDQWGSLFLDDLAPIIVKSARLQQEINEVLSQNSKKEEEVTCFGMRFPGQWKNLGGLRVSPYTCDFGAMWLQIHATVRVTDRRGQGFETITDKAMNNATNVSETNLKWKWTTERPVLNFKILSWPRPWMLSAIDCTGT
jgi:hypothetical protein